MCIITHHMLEGFVAFNIRGLRDQMKRITVGLDPMREHIPVLLAILDLDSLPYPRYCSYLSPQIGRLDA